MSDLRDPRITPIPGDKTKYPGGNVYTILRVENGGVEFVSDAEGIDFLPLDQWQDMARYDEIIERAHP